MQQNQIKSAQKKAQKKAFLVISHKSAQNHTKSPHPAPHKACRFYQAARTPPRIDHYPTHKEKCLMVAMLASAGLGEVAQYESARAELTAINPAWPKAALFTTVMPFIFNRVH
ncbi:hypothetical protein ABR013_004890 [Escherichia coli]